MAMINISTCPFTKSMVNTDLYKITKCGENSLFIEARYKPKKYEPKSNSQLNNNENSSLNTLSKEQKKELTTKLNSGQGNMSMEEWDDFLLSLVDSGLINNNDRMQALGHGAISDNNAPGGILDDIFSWQWTGDPLKWLDQLDFSFKKECMYLEVGGYSTKDVSYIKERVSNVADIIKELMK